jgi:uncharacterized damage-inducible protein DinB
MVLTKEELISMLTHEVHTLSHLVTKTDPEKLDYRPTPGQRSTLELLQYLTIMGPIHLGAVKSGALAMDSWRNDWNTREAAAKKMSLEQVAGAIGELSSIYEQTVAAFTDADLREEIELFGVRSSRGAWIVKLLLNHHVAYRMQLFLYLKSSGREELNTMNLWVGTDSPPKPA